MSSLFRSLLGDALDRVPAPVRALHEVALPHRFEGRVLVRAGGGMVARWIARQAGLPLQDTEGPIAVTIERDGDGECWTREFGVPVSGTPRSAPMRTRLWRDGEHLIEGFGPMQLRFRLQADSEGITWMPVSLRALQSGGEIRSAAMLRGVHAREFERDGRYGFDAGAVLPMLGRLVNYDGWLHVG